MKKKIPYILFADDDPDDQELLATAILKEIPSVIIEYVNNGQQLLMWLDACTPDDLPALVLVDYKMPVLTAPEVLERLSRDHRYNRMPKFVWSTSDRCEYIEECKRYGALDYFIKPNTDLELSHIVSNIAQFFQSHLLDRVT